VCSLYVPNSDPLDANSAADAIQVAHGGNK
jgi:hypothetical protein